MLPRAYVEMSSPPEVKRAAIVRRWHAYRRTSGAMAAFLGLASAIILGWPEVLVLAGLGVVIAVDATLALRSARVRTTLTIAADIVLTGLAMSAVGVPGVAVGVVVSYFVLVVAVLGEPRAGWRLGLLAASMGFVVTFGLDVLGLSEHPVQHTIVGGIIVVAVFGLSTVGVASEFARVTRRSDRSFGRRVEVADAISAASRALVAGDDVGAMAAALDVIRDATSTTVVFVERNVDDPKLGLCAVVEERSVDTPRPHASFDRSARMPWSIVPGARSHLDGGAPFFYRVEETRGTTYDRGGEAGIQVEVNLPIMVNGVWAGVVGAADGDPDRIWRTDDLMLLRSLADLTAALWERTDGSRARESLIGNLDRRLRFEEALASSSRALLGERSADLETALKSIGSAARVDEVWVTETVTDESGDPAARVAAAWAAPGIEATRDAELVVSYEAIPDVRRALQADEVAFWDDGETILVSVATTVAGAWHGSVSFARHENDALWTERDVAFYQTVANILSAFFERSANRARLEESLSSKDQLIATVSHELRTPLTAVVGLAEVLIAGGKSFGLEEHDQLMEIIASSSREMVDLVDDLLVAARSQDGSLPVFPERIDLSLLAQSVLSQLVVPDGVDVIIEDTDSVALADPVRVRQIIRNLLTNAFRYGDSPITVSVGKRDGAAYLDVHDRGSGVLPGDRDRIFDPYTRAESSRTVKDSVGLGLALSRRLANLMHGSLTYVVGEGTTFRLTVPLPDRETTQA